jgi:DNA primase
MRRYEPAYVECLLDGDSAGRKAALRALPLAFKAGLEFRFLLLPEKADPDDLLRQNGASALDALRESSRSAIELAIEENLPTGRAATTHEKTTALRSVFELLQHVSSEVAREDYIQIASRMIGVDPRAALKDFQKGATAQGATQGRPNPPPATTTPKDPLLTQASWELLWFVSHFPEYGAPLSEIVDYEWINTSSPAGKLLARILAEIKEGLIEDATKVETIIESIEDRKLLAEINTRDLEVDDPKTQIEFCLQTLYSNYLKSRRKQLEQRISNADPNSEEQLQLMREVSTLRKSLAKPLQLKL